MNARLDNDCDPARKILPRCAVCGTRIPGEPAARVELIDGGTWVFCSVGDGSCFDIQDKRPGFRERVVSKGA